MNTKHESHLPKLSIMGKKNKKNQDQPPVYISPPPTYNGKDAEVPDYDPQTKVRDPFEDDLDFLLKDNVPMKGQAMSYTIHIDKEIHIPTEQKRGQTKRNTRSNAKPNTTNVTKRLKREILNFDITFSSDESEEEEEEEEEEDIGKPTNAIDSEKYLRAELGLDSDSDTDLEIGGDEKVDALAEMYDQLEFNDPSDPVRSEYFDGNGGGDKRIRNNKKPASDLKHQEEGANSSDITVKCTPEIGLTKREKRRIKARELRKQPKESNERGVAVSHNQTKELNSEDTSKKSKTTDKKRKSPVLDASNGTNRKETSGKIKRQLSRENGTETESLERSKGSEVSKNWRKLSKKMENEAQSKKSDIKNDDLNPKDNKKKRRPKKESREGSTAAAKGKKRNGAAEKDSVNTKEKKEREKKPESINTREKNENKDDQEEKPKKDKKEKSKARNNEEIDSNSAREDLKEAIDRRLVQLKKMKKDAIPHVS